MGDSTDGSSNAAQSAQPVSKDTQDDQGGFLRRIFGALTPTDDTPQDPVIPTKTQSGMVPGLVQGIGNLSKMVVEDVAIPKADIVSVPVDISKADLVKVFRDSGLTRLPV